MIELENTKNGENQSEGKDRDTDGSAIKNMGSVMTDGSRGRIYCMSIIGQVEGHSNLPSDVKTTKYEHVIPKLAEIEQDSSVDGLLLILNTVGGDVEAGLAIAELIASMKTPTVSIVLGGGHSIGVPLAVSAKRSFIVPSATMTIHPIRTSGTVIGVYQMFDYLNKVQERVIGFVTKHAKITADRLRGIMLETDEIANDIGTILFGEEAVSCGLIDGVGGLSEALDALYKMIDGKKRGKEIAKHDF